MTEEIKQELIAKIHELEWKNNIKSFEIINWINDLLTKYPCKEKKVEEAKKEIKVELPEEKKVVKIEVTSWLKWWSDAWIDSVPHEEVKTAPKRKISFIKKK